ncbi:Rossmann-fold NAD(P)-binding domain-containing protein [Lysobacter claricitrinus]|uniref:oxidoreductase n=1 Tax=Lysobacter claricitrinus TaxID=3367728 RepID=UPI0037DBF025
MRLMIVGSTGLVGQGVLAACRAASDVERIVLPLRRHADAAHDPRVVHWHLKDLRSVDGTEPGFSALDACVYCVGVVPGLSETAYRDVTVDLTLRVARAFARANPNGTFVYVSGAGSDAHSMLMPLRVKGQAEDALRALGIRTLMLRPGVVQPVDGVHSPHPVRDAAYALAGPLLSAAARGAPSVVTTSSRIGHAVLAALRQPDPPAVLENADINALG